MDLSDTEADGYIQALIDQSVSALFPQVLEKIHKWSQATQQQLGRRDSSSRETAQVDQPFSHRVSLCSSPLSGLFTGAELRAEAWMPRWRRAAPAGLSSNPLFDRHQCFAHTSI